MRRKFIIIGPSGVGKTTIKRIFFEQENPLNLINTTLDPTIGDETSIYQYGNTIAVHDLAGQQLQGWFEEAEDHFIETDLIICVVDSQNDSHENITFLEKVIEIRDEYCINSTIAIMIHKIDLISKDRLATQKKIFSNFIISKFGMSLFFTSISKDYYIETMKTFFGLLKGFLQPYQIVNFNEMTIKLEILQQLDKMGGNSEVEDITSKLNIKSEVLHLILKKMHQEAKIILDSESGQINLTEEGSKCYYTFKQKLDLVINGPKNLNIQYIQGLILSDIYGRAFYAFENQEKFFASNFPSNNECSSAIYTLISMFFTAIKDFGEGIDESGISSVNITGTRTQIVYIRYADLLGIIFLSEIQIDDSILSFLKTFFRSVFIQNKTRMDAFKETGNLKSFDNLSKEIFPQLEKLDKEISTIQELQSAMAQDRLLQLYQCVTEKNYSSMDYDFLKNLIFRQLLLSSNSIIDEIQRFGSEEK